MDYPNASGTNHRNYLNRMRRSSTKNEFNRLISTIVQSLPIIIGIILLSLIIAFSIIRWTSPIYEAKSILQLGQNDKASKILDVTQAFEEDDLMAELEFMQSRLLIINTIKDLNINVRYFSEGKFLNYESYPSNSYLIDSLIVHDPSLYGENIYVTFNDASTFKLSINNESLENLNVNQVYHFDRFTFLLKTPSGFEKPDNGEIKYFKLFNPEMLANEFHHNLKVKPYNPRAKSIEISIRSKNAALAKDLINTHVAAYMKYKENKQNQSAENILTFLTNQLDTVSKNLQDAERLLASFRSKNNFTGQSSNSLFDHLDEYDNEIIELEFQNNILKELEIITNLADADIDIYHLMAQLVGSNYEEVLKGMLNELTELLKRREQYKYNITEENEKVKLINYQIDIQKKLIKESISSLRIKLNRKMELLTNKKKTAERQFVNIPTKEVELARYQRLFNISEKYYNLLLEKRTEYKISKAGYVSNNKILSKAQVQSNPIYPKKSLIYIGALFLGLVLSTIFTLLRYITYNKIKSLDDIVKHTDASVKLLGIVPKLKTNNSGPQLLVHPNKNTILAESLRSIRTNIQFENTLSKCKTFAVTSTISGEGKTFISVNLAAVFSLSGKKVIVIDLDLRKPKIHTVFGNDNSKGLSEYLNKKNSLSEIITNSGNPNLHYITSGLIPSNPYELLNNGNIKNLIEELSKTYDVILFDTPPIGLVSDGYAALQLVDHPIYIFKSEYSKIGFIQNVDRLIHENNLTNLSCILNGVKSSGTRYGRQWGYGYGYISNDKESKKYFDN